MDSAKTWWAAGAVLVMASQTVAAQDGGPGAIDRGQALYENHCRFCHENWAHERVTRQVRTSEELRRRVAGWALHSGLDWSEEEVAAVTDYLDRRFYHFR